MRGLFVLLLALAGSSSWAACPDLPGTADLFAPTRPRIIWVGEMHGTNEMPALFGDLICVAGESGRKLVVVLERGRDEQANWDDFFESGDRARLTSGKIWHWATQDGRSSKAMVAFAERLRRYKTEGRILAVLLMQRGWDEKPSANHALDNETSMADTVKQAAQTYPDALILVYSGNLHARKTMSPFDKELPLAASLLPPGEVFSLNVEGGQGTAWNCIPDCGVHRYFPYTAEDRPRGIYPLAKSDEEGYDAVAYTGIPMTASYPAINASDK